MNPSRAAILATLTPATTATALAALHPEIPRRTLQLWIRTWRAEQGLPPQPTGRPSTRITRLRAELAALSPEEREAVTAEG